MRLPVPLSPSPSPSPVRLPACALPFLLLPVADAGTSRGPDTPGSQPYLQVGAAPALRFATAKPPAPVWHPPFVFTWPDLTTLAQEITAARAAAPSAFPSAFPPAASPVGPAAQPSPPSPGLAPAPPPGITILPDDTPRDLRSEEVLLYFQYPAAPAAGATPPSSATYRQK